MTEQYYGVRLKSIKDGKWFWHRGKSGDINKFTEEAASARASMWAEKDAKVMKITKRSK